MKINFPVLLFGITGVLLLLCLCDMPYGYYIFTRAAVAVACIILAFNFKSIGIGSGFYIYLVIAIVFQPIFKIPFGKILWQIFDILLALNFLKIAWNNAIVKGFVPRNLRTPDIKEELNSPIRGMHIAELLLKSCPKATRYKLGGSGLGHYIVYCDKYRIQCSILYINIHKKVIVEIYVDGILWESKEVNTRDRTNEAVVQDILVMKTFKDLTNC